MYFFEFCESDCNGISVLVTSVTNMDATLNRKIMDATVKLNDIDFYLKTACMFI